MTTTSTQWETVVQFQVFGAKCRISLNFWAFPSKFVLLRPHWPLYLQIYRGKLEQPLSAPLISNLCTHSQTSLKHLQHNIEINLLVSVTWNVL